MKISMGSWAFSFGPYADDPVPFDKTVSKLAEAGLDGIEICGFPPHITLESHPTRESRTALVRFLDDHKLGVSGYSADFSFANPVTPGNGKKYLELFRRNLELCADIGSPVIRVDSVAAPGAIDDRDYNSALRRLADVWHTAADIASQNRVRVCWEFEPGFAFNKPSEIKRLHELVNHENFFVMFDTSHAYMCGVSGARQHGPRETLHGGIPEFLKLLQGRIGAIHVIDSDGTLYGDETSTHRPFGEGCIGFQALTPHLLAVPGIEWWCIDLCFWAGAWELVESSVTFVRGLLEKASKERAS